MFTTKRIRALLQPIMPQSIISSIHLVAKICATPKQLDFFREAIQLDMTGHIDLYSANPDIPGLFKWVVKCSLKATSGLSKVKKPDILDGYGYLAMTSNNFDVVYEAYQDVAQYELWNTKYVKSGCISGKFLRGLDYRAILHLYNKWTTRSQALMPKETYNNIGVIAKYHSGKIAEMGYMNFLPILKGSDIDWIYFCSTAKSSGMNEFFDLVLTGGYLTSVQIKEIKKLNPQ
jgi:hypothetical protein